MEYPINKLLARQIKKHFGTIENVPEAFKGILNDINNTYQNHNDDIELLQNSIEISSQELRNAFQQHKKDAETQKETINKIKEAIDAIKPTEPIEIIQNKTEIKESDFLFDSLIKLIEEHKHTEHEIRKLLVAVEQSPASIVITDIKGNIEYVNPKLCDLTGYKKEEVVGQNPRILKTETSSPEIYEDLWNTISSGKIWKGEFLNKKKNGDLFWELASISPVKNDMGKIINYLAIKEDITNRKLTEETLENERALFRTIIDLIPDAVYVKDKQCRKTLANPKDVLFAGKKTEDEIIGKTDAEVYPSKQAKQSYEEDLFVLKSGKSILNKEGTLIDRNGKHRTLLVSKVPLYDMHNNITGLIGVTHDITNRKQAENEVKRVSTRLALATYAGGVGVWDYDIINDHLLWDEQMYRLYGIGEENFKISYTSWINSIHPDDVQQAEKEIQMALRGEKVYDTEFQVIWLDGTIHNIRALATIRKDKSGKTTRLIGTNWDITDQKNTESILLEARKEAESANKAKSEFLANVSHEIRTPMNAIIGFAEILKDKITNPQLKDHTKTILNSGRTLLTLINDILDLSKIEAGRLEVEYEVIHYANIIKDIKSLFAPKIESKKLSLEIINPPNLPDYIYLDEVRFHQILFNLVGNAIKFTEKGFVRIETFIKPTNNSDEIELIIEIEDSGIGIPSDQLNSIFDAFTQQNGQSNRQYEGTGLGLAITKRLIEKMNGTISVTSRVGKGSIFTIHFKSIKQAHLNSTNEHKNKDQDREINFAAATIMIVDDIDFNIQVVEHLLDFADFRFISAHSGEKALELLEMEKPDIIFMDIRMHGMSGISATEIIKKNPSLNKIPVIAFTASALQNQMDIIKKLFDGFVSKPISKKIIIKTLKKHIQFNYGAPIIEEKQISIIDLQLDETDIKNAIELLPILENEMQQEWNEISGNLIIFEIEEFCDKLQTIYQQHQCKPLETYTLRLRESIESFDVESIEKYMNEFGDLIRLLKKHTK